MAIRSNARYCVPTAPILERIEEWVRQHNYRIQERPDGTVMETGGVVLAEEVFQINLRALRKQNWMSFDTADRILCKCGQVNDWFHDPVLKEVYEQAPLPLNRREMELLGMHEEVEKRKRWNANNSRNARRSKERREKALQTKPSARNMIAKMLVEAA